MVVNVKNMIDDELFFGHKACAGCGGSLALRAALKVLGPNAVAALPAGCMSAVGFNFPQLAFANNAMITPFAATASVLTGIEAGLRAQGKKPDDCTVVGFAGDGGTADIGIQALSGAIDRNDPTKVDASLCLRCLSCVRLCPLGSKAFSDPGFQKTVAWCLENFQKPDKSPVFFL